MSKEIVPTNDGLATLFETKNRYDIETTFTGVLTSLLSKSSMDVKTILNNVTRSITEEGKVCVEDMNYYEIPAKALVNKNTGKIVFLMKNGFEIVIDDMENPSDSAKMININEYVKQEKK